MHNQEYLKEKERPEDLNRSNSHIPVNTVLGTVLLCATFEMQSVNETSNLRFIVYGEICNSSFIIQRIHFCLTLALRTHSRFVSVTLHVSQLSDANVSLQRRINVAKINISLWYTFSAGFVRDNVSFTLLLVFHYRIFYLQLLIKLATCIFYPEKSA